MIEYKCPICEKRVCDSNKTLKILKTSNSNLGKADLIIKCKNCKTRLSVKIIKNAVGLRTDEPPGSGQFVT